jgi:hypothetical protein
VIFKDVQVIPYPPSHEVERLTFEILRNGWHCPVCKMDIIAAISTHHVAYGHAKMCLIMEAAGLNFR